MMNDLQSFINAGKMLDRIAVPEMTGAWMTKQTFLDLGGDEKVWKSLHGDALDGFVGSYGRRR